MSPKKFSKISYPQLEISLYLSHFSKEVHQLKDWQKYKKFRIIWNLCTNIPGLSHKNSELEVSLCLSNFSKEVGKLTDWKTYMKFEYIWNYCRNIRGMSPKDFRKIYHPEPDILTSWVSGNKCTAAQTQLPLELTPSQGVNWKPNHNPPVSVTASTKTSRPSRVCVV